VIRSRLSIRRRLGTGLDDWQKTCFQDLGSYATNEMTAEGI
jgi:hypothetical protein